MRECSSPLRNAPVAISLIKLSQGSIAAALLTGLSVALVTQSSSTVTIITVTAVQSGLLTQPDSVMIVLGAGLGSGASILVVGATARGSQRQLVLFQGLLKSAAVACCCPSFISERIGSSIGLEGLLQRLIADPGLFLAVICLLSQGASLTVYLCARSWLPGILVRLAPPAPEENLARPRFIYPGALRAPGNALLPVTREHRRLAGFLPAHLQVDIEQGQTAVASIHASQVATSLSNAIASFLAQIAGGNLSRIELKHLSILRTRDDVLRALHESAAEYMALRGACVPGGDLEPIFMSLREGIAALFRCVEQATGSHDPDDVAILGRLTSDRTDLVDEIRFQLLEIEGAEEPEARRAASLMTVFSNAWFGSSDATSSRRMPQTT